MPELTKETMFLIERARTSSYFTCVGLPKPMNVRSIRCWDEAILAFQQDSWRDLVGTATYSMVSLVEDADWNQKVRLIKQQVDEIANRMLYTAALLELSAESQKRVVDEARTQLISACIEHETASLHSFGLFRILAQWLLDGYLACGWEGHYPDGALVVF